MVYMQVYRDVMTWYTGRDVMTWYTCMPIESL